MSKEKNALRLLCGRLLICCIVFMIPGCNITKNNVDNSAGSSYIKKKESKEKESKEKEKSPGSVDVPDTGLTDEGEHYESPVDFVKLWEENEDIIAYLNIPEIKIGYPILHKPGDNSFYIKRALDGSYSKSGSIFIEDYNSDDFTDQVSIVYGHNMKDGSYFGNLQRYYSDTEWLDKKSIINIYLPDKILNYTVKAAVPYSSLHILHYYDFSKADMFRAFIESVYSVRSINANYSEEAIPSGDNPILILSTCLNGNNKKRFIVVAEQTNVL